ncbi:RHS repeat-associated protein [Chryseobacterium sediminis]|uniref:RHS repeat-associated protein n=1 Tax=Chryseobacterium sediminis TaxID=1679494 RepID=A0ABR6PV61_9FLAO|nr:RHS repeat-associated core domain-containing protein [Chryseobacterium sediminis]MBB6329594.1 RHS repeat-associated protein [Chryseobacterium sediminis]
MRIAFAKDNAGVVQSMDTNNYYPFGLNHIGGTNYSNFGGYYNYKFGGKELQETGWSDFGARMYMPDIGRWGVIDPLAEKMRRWSPYNYAFDNPMRFVDPDGRVPLDDYRFGKNGRLELINKTNDNFDRIYNSDKSNSLQVDKGFFNNMFESKGKNQSTILVNNNTKDLKRAYKFFAKNSNVEWQYNVFKGDRTVGTLASTHTKGSVENWGSLAYRVLGADSKIKLIYSSHSHPGKYDSNTGWPAYPSGFDYSLNPSNESGDRQNFDFYKNNFPGRTPSTFNVFVPDNPETLINYDNNSVQRTFPQKNVQEIEEVVITIKRK